MQNIYLLSGLKPLFMILIYSFLNNVKKSIGGGMCSKKIKIVYYNYIIYFNNYYYGNNLNKYLSMIKFKKKIKAVNFVSFRDKNFFYKFIIRWFFYFLCPSNLFQVIELLYNMFIVGLKC